MSLEVKLQVFEGPLDLLMFLIEKNKVDIYDIPIADIADQYMDYIRQMKRNDMNVMSEFLVMAATLIDIKCRMLLPREVNEEGEVEDPRTELVQKLLEYKMYKYMSYELKDRHLDAEKVWVKKATLPKEVSSYVPPVDYDELIGENNLASLREIFENVMKKREDKIDPIRSKFGKIQKEEVDMDKKMDYVRNFVLMQRRCNFRTLLEKQHSKLEIIVTFMVILELMKVGDVIIEQEDAFGEIYISSREAA